jgi:hypothetical protein
VVMVKIILVLRARDRCMQSQVTGVRSGQLIEHRESRICTIVKDDATRLKSIDVRLW